MPDTIPFINFEYYDDITPVRKHKINTAQFGTPISIT